MNVPKVQVGLPLTPVVVESRSNPNELSFANTHMLTFAPGYGCRITYGLIVNKHENMLLLG